MDVMPLSVVLEGINARTIPLEILEAPTWCGRPRYRAAGWTLEVFDDCDDWDYLQWAESPDGQRVQYPIGVPANEEEGLVLNFQPTHLEDWGY